METPNDTIPNGPVGENDVLTPAPSRLGIIGLVLGTIGFIIYCCSLLIIFFIIYMGGGLDILDAPMSELAIISYCGLLFGVVGGIFGAAGLTRRENKILGIISITLGLLMLCASSVLVWENPYIFMLRD